MQTPYLNSPKATNLVPYFSLLISVSEFLHEPHRGFYKLTNLKLGAGRIWVVRLGFLFWVLFLCLFVCLEGGGINLPFFLSWEGNSLMISKSHSLLFMVMYPFGDCSYNSMVPFLPWYSLQEMIFIVRNGSSFSFPPTNLDNPNLSSLFLQESMNNTYKFIGPINNK